MSRRTVFASPFISVVAVPYGDDADGEPYYVLETDDFVAVLALTPDGRVPLVRQFRPAVGRETLELPSGHRDAGESPEVAAARELLEETGFRARSLVALGDLAPDSGRYSNRLWAFFTDDLEAVAPWHCEEAGASAVPADLAELARMVDDGRLEHTSDLAMILLAERKGLLRLPLLSP